jgi:hypothetical protein
MNLAVSFGVRVGASAVDYTRKKLSTKHLPEEARVRRVCRGSEHLPLLVLVRLKASIPDRYDFIGHMNGSPATGKETSGLPEGAVLGSFQ